MPPDAMRTRPGLALRWWRAREPSHLPGELHPILSGGADGGGKPGPGRHRRPRCTARWNSSGRWQDCAAYYPDASWTPCPGIHPPPTPTSRTPSPAAATDDGDARRRACSALSCPVSPEFAVERMFSSVGPDPLARRTVKTHGKWLLLAAVRCRDRVQGNAIRPKRRISHSASDVTNHGK
jgi:hypothetical protein